ncbi:tRNA-uridine aminocarboxypropyltransferase 2 isoform X1 [Patella vulgata]|uniref:tRNA-uridine aminocarboxypropyltransferase 2 isoform X1 n=1 Tax=Patella vulgata TaxID=6465 RepID=UPI00218000D3|nr:tRNA-uridine aminocarboxypropyltransferase 2 isoform X1 [Patella vulgata]
MAAPMNVNTDDEQNTENEDNNLCDFLFTLSDLAEETMTQLPVVIRRDECKACTRPIKVCWCPYLPPKPIDIKTNLYILQHPYELSRCLRTAPMLVRSLPPEKCHVIQGKKFPRSRHPDLLEIMESPKTIMLSPGPDAIDIETLPLTDITEYNLILIDGTWAQAKGIYYQNPMLKIPQKVQINYSSKSKYIIRTQPNDSSLSTLESAAVALSILENKPDIIDILTKPLVALCNFQLQYGATSHQSKEYRMKNGLWTKKLPKSWLKKQEKAENLKTNDAV